MTPVHVTLREVDADNWKAVARVEVKEEQREFVSPVTYYLCLCHYGRKWKPLAIYEDDEVVGFVMWAIDATDNSGWIGGLIIDAQHQNRGLARTAIEALLRRFREEYGCTSAALSYAPAHVRARTLYALLGFEVTGEFRDDEPVARRSI